MTTATAVITQTLTRHSLHLSFLFGIFFIAGQRECVSHESSSLDNYGIASSHAAADVAVTEYYLMVSLLLLFLFNTFFHLPGYPRDRDRDRNAIIHVLTSASAACLNAEEGSDVDTGGAHIFFLMKHVLKCGVATIVAALLWAICCFLCGSFLRDIDPFACVYVACLLFYNPLASDSHDRGVQRDKSRTGGVEVEVGSYHYYMVLTGLVIPSAAYLLDWDRGGGCEFGGGERVGWLLLSPLPTLAGGYVGSVMGECWHCWYCWHRYRSKSGVK